MLCAHMTLFDVQHLGALAGIGLIAVGLSVFLRRAARRPNGAALRQIVCRVLAVLLIFNAVFQEVAEIHAGAWTFQKSMPLHLCDFAAYLSALALFGAATPSPSPFKGEGRGEGVPRQNSLIPTLSSAGSGRKRRISIRQLFYELSYFWGIGGTTQALLTPDIHDPFPTRAYFGYFANHGGIIVAVLMMTLGLKMRPLPGAVRRVWLATHLLVIPVALANWLLNANYMFLCGPPEHPSLYDHFGPWPWSLLTLEGVLIVFLLLCYAPFWRSKKSPSTM